MRAAKIKDMPKEWNESGIPIAYLITFRCYGTWLHGDKRGSVDRFHNAHDTPYAPPNPQRNEYNQNLLKNKPVSLGSKRRKFVEKAIRETCKMREWKIYAINIRTNHVHVVVAVGEKHPGQVLIAFKANATREMRENGCWALEDSPWVSKGSKRYLWSEKSVEKAVDYVINGQGKPLPDFDR